MQNELDSQQKMLLWLLLVQPDAEMFLADVSRKVDLKPVAKRRMLVTWGFIEEFQKPKLDGKGRATTCLRLLDKGWEWCQDHIAEQIPAKTKTARDVLQGVFQILDRYFSQQNHCCSLGDLVNQSKPAESKPVVTTASPVIGQPLKDRVRETCRAITEGAEGVRIRLADVRSRLSDVAPEELNSILLQMEREGAISLYRLDNPEEITEADKAAALVTVGGTENHILYEGGLHS
jgi:hypothetical protein